MNHRYKYPKNWDQLRVIILIRDNFTCTICGKHQDEIFDTKGKNRSLHIMHLDGNTYNNKYVLDGSVYDNPDNNLASGCYRCHRLYDIQFKQSYSSNKKVNHQVVGLDMKIGSLKQYIKNKKV